MEIGSFIEMQFTKGREYFSNQRDIARLNSGRAAIFHAFLLTGCSVVWLPYYQCETVRDFLKTKGVSLKYYHIDTHFNPIDLSPSDNEAVILVNYFGIMSQNRIFELSKVYKHVIIDNSQAFFCQPLKECYNVYSARKFIGVPDGAYVVGIGADMQVDTYEQCYSSDTAVFLLQRIEYGCEGKTYKSRMQNEKRIDSEDILKMSLLTRTILDGTDYEFIIMKRKENFAAARGFLDNINKINIDTYFDSACVPMVYPLLVDNDKLLDVLLKAKHFQGHWWGYLTKEMPESSFEYELSKYIIPITIDQRYTKDDIKSVVDVVYSVV